MKRKQKGEIIMNTWLNLEDKTVIVTGGASGIGKAVAQEFIHQGANVVVCDMSPNIPHLDDATEDNFLYVVTNVTDKADVENMITQTVEKFGTVDVLVNNAGINIPRLLVMNTLLTFPPIC